MHLTPQDVTEGAEEEAWDALFDTDALRSCSCPACNPYLPEGEYKPGTVCEVVGLIYKIIEAREAANA